MMGAAAQTRFDFEFGLSSYMRLEINMPLFAARRTVLSAAAAAALLVLTGCSKSDDAKSSASSADTLEKPTLVVGMELAYPPFEGKDEQGNPAGVSVDFMKDFAKSAGKAIKIENIAFDGLIPALLTGKVDMVMSSMTITDERRKTVDFSDPYANAMLGILTHKGSGIKSVEDLNQKGRRIAAKIGSTGYLYAQNNLKNAAVTALPDESACVMEVATGKADGFIYDQLTIYRNWQKNPETTEAVFIPFQKVEPWGVAVRKGDAKLLNVLNVFIADYRKQGGFDRLTEKHLKAEKAAFDQLGFKWFFDMTPAQNQ